MPDYPICSVCGSVVYRIDLWCSSCAIKDGIESIEKAEKLLNFIKEQERNIP